MWDEAGCFVYEVTTRSRIFVRSSPSVEDNFNLVQNRYFDPEELVSVDLIRHAREDYTADGNGNANGNAHNINNYGSNNNNNNGPFLRLSDGSGWILAKQEQGGRGQGRQEEFVRRIPIEDASDRPDKLWTFYADNIPYGIELRRHPVEELRNPEDTNRFSPACGAGGITYLPMQKIVCDRKLCHGNTRFFRVQGTCGWVFDKRNGQRNNNNNNEDDHYREMIVESNLVETGLFAFRMTSTNGMAIRKSCHVGDGTNATKATIKQGEIIVADVIRHSPLDNGNGPFLRLTDGSGWLFQHKLGGSPLLEEIPITNGTFRLKIQTPNGIKPRGQPIDSYYYNDHTRVPVLKQGETILCDQKLSSPSGISFYRKKGTDSWIFDKHTSGDVSSEVIAEIVSEPESPSSCSLLGKTARNSNDDANFAAASNGLKHPWSPHFIRGNANAIYGLEEIDFDPRRKVISYKSARDDAIINVHFDNRMIGTVMGSNSNSNSNSNRTTQGRVQRFHRNCNDAELQAIFQDPRTYQRGGPQSIKRARLMPSPIATTALFQNTDTDRNWNGDGNDSSSNFRSELSRNPITPDASLSSTTSNIEVERDIGQYDDGFDAEQETRKNIMDCQNEMKNLRYREGNLLRAIQMHEEERMHDARTMKSRTEQIHLYRIQKEEDDRRRRLEQDVILRRIEEERRAVQDRRRKSRLVFENVYIGSIVGCFLGLVLSPVFGPVLVREFGLEHLLVM